jgi:flagellar assembly factor FliW
MAVTLQSSRFGQLELPEEAILEFPNGLIGLGGSRYALLARADEALFAWLHSIDDPDLALPVTSPWQFFEDYAVDLSDADVERTGIVDPSKASVYVTVRAGTTLKDFSANLRAPILVLNGRGFQVINQDAEAPVRAALFAEDPSEEAGRAA